MKTLIKRPNYTLSIKTSCYSSFSFYPFFRNDRIPASPSALTSALYIGESRPLYLLTKAELKLQALSLSLKVNSLKLDSLRPTSPRSIIYRENWSSCSIYMRDWSSSTKIIFFFYLCRPERQNYFGLYSLPYIYAARGSTLVKTLQLGHIMI